MPRTTRQSANPDSHPRTIHRGRSTSRKRSTETKQRRSSSSNGRKRSIGRSKPPPPPPTQSTLEDRQAKYDDNTSNDISQQHTVHTNTTDNTIHATSSSKFKSFRIRLYSTIVLITSFSAIIYSGHVPLMFMVLGIQTVMIRELFQLARVAQEERKIPGFRAQQWFFYFVTAFWVYVRFIKHNLMVEITSSARLARILGWVLQQHTMLCFSLYTAGFVSFVLTLKKGAYTYQFGQYAWTHMILLVVFMPSSFFVSNIFEGIIWFILPCALVIVNDIAAYLAGLLFGRTPLIKLSPKKTWEGFLGGFVGTVAASWYLAALMSKSAWLTCPRTDLSVFKPMECTEPPPIYKPHPVMFGRGDDAAPPLLEASQMQFHALALAVFASAIAPFGGFFASGFKRGMGIKDFGRSIPGHGGMTDRMDCQIVMAAFSYIYYHTFVTSESGPLSAGAVLSMVWRLSLGDQVEVFEHMANVLVSQGVQLPMEGIVQAVSEFRTSG